MEIGGQSNVVQSNGVIGTTNGAGIALAVADNNTIRGNNVIDNAGQGIFLFGTSSGNSIQGNFVSRNSDGIEIECSGPNNHVSGNQIVQNGGTGVFIRRIGSSENSVDGNTISGNGFDGVLVSGSVSGNTIDGNTISSNGRNGVRIVRNSESPGDPGDPLGITISANMISDNTLLGIDLGGSCANAPCPADGVTANDTGDTDTGPNGLQNFPVISSVAASDTGTTVTGTLNSTPNASFTLEFFSNTACDPSGFGEGESFLDSTSVVTDANGNASFSVTLMAGVTGVTATATETISGNTSEFSRCVQPTGMPSVEAIKTAVAALPAAAFKTAGVRTATLSILDEVQEAIEAGTLSDAIQKLQNLRRRLDGCGTAADRDDWIVSCTAQTDIRGMIDRLIALLKS